MFTQHMLARAAVLCILAHTVFSQQNLPGFNIGTSFNGLDVAVDGEAVGPWRASQPPNQFNATTWPPNVFYIWLSTSFPITSDYLNLTIKGSTLEGIKLNITQGNVIVEKGADNFLLYTDVLCQASETAAVAYIELTVNDPPNYEPVNLAIQKVCQFPLFNVLYQCLFSYCKVLDDNVRDPSWSSEVVPISQEVPWFYFYLNTTEPNVDFAEFNMKVSSDSDANIVYTPSLPNGNIATGYSRPIPTLDLDLLCQQNRLQSVINVSVTLIPTGWDTEGNYANNTVTFNVAKQCGDLTGNPRVGFNIGTSPLSNNIVANGLTQSSYRDFTTPYTINELWLPFPLYFSLNTESTPSTLYYNVSFVEKIVNNIAIVEESGQLSANLTTTSGGNAAQIIVDFDCLKSGLEQITLTIDVRDAIDSATSYDHAVVFLQKQCLFPVFNMYLAADGSAVIAANRLQQTWNYISPSDTLTDSFFVSLNATSEANQQNFKISNIKTDSNYLTAGVLESDKIINSRSDVAQIDIVYNCVVDKPSTTPVSFEMDFGWSVNFTINYQKHCNATSGSSGWTAAQIFFFVVFILLLAFFLFGSIYKYFILKQRGLDIIPGITYYRKCCKCCPASSARYTPQMDSDYVSTTDDHQGGGRHTNYGTTSYQPNL